MGASWSAEDEGSAGQQSLKKPLTTDSASRHPETIGIRPHELSIAPSSQMLQPDAIGNKPQSAAAATTQAGKIAEYARLSPASMEHGHGVEKMNKAKSVMVRARDLLIVWSDDSRYWQWTSLKETNESTEVAVLVNVCWLELRGRYPTSKLSAGVQYKVAFQVRMKDGAYGWEAAPVNLCLTLPDGTKQESKLSLGDLPAGEWKDIEAGRFKNSLLGKNGDIEFSLYEIEGGDWKRGLEVKGVIIQPCN